MVGFFLMFMFFDDFLRKNVDKKNKSFLKCPTYYLHTITSENGHKPFMFSWTEEVASKGSNEVESCLMYFTQLSQLTFQQNIKHLIIWSDSCSGQNKNFNVICLYQYMILKGLNEIIDHKFPVVGHYLIIS